MGQHMIYKSGNKEFSFKFKPTDIDIAIALGKVEFSKEIQVIFDVDDYCVEREINAKSMSLAIEKIITAIKENPNTLPYVYCSRFEMPPDSGLFSSGSGGISGIRINSEIYSLDCGFNECILTRWEKDGNGLGRKVEYKDIRDVKVLKTDNFGDIVIYKRKAAGDFVKTLKKINEFIKKSKSDTIKKMLV